MNARINDSLLQPLESPVLQRLVRRMPGCVTPDHMTCFGVVGALIACAGYALARDNALFLALASAGVAFNWFGDSLDGSLARYRGVQRRRYGFFVDHTADLFSQMLIALGIALSGFVRVEIVCLGLITYLAMMVFLLISEHATGVMKITYMKIGPTEIRASLVALNFTFYILGPMTRPTVIGGFSALDLFVIAASAATFLSLAISAYRQASRLARQDPPNVVSLPAFGIQTGAVSIRLESDDERTPFTLEALRRDRLH